MVDVLISQAQSFDVLTLMHAGCMREPYRGERKSRPKADGCYGTPI